MNLPVKRVNPAVLPPLKEVLTLAFWYKADLRAFVGSCLPGNPTVAHLDWGEYKRNIVNQLVDKLAQQPTHSDDLLSLYPLAVPAVP